MRTAAMHEWLVNYAGSERVLEQMLNCFPASDLFSVVDFLSDEERTFIQGKSATTTFIQKLPFAKTKYRQYLPLMPLATEQLDLSNYDVILSSSHAVAKGVLTGPDQLHICYVHSPIRYAWDLQHQYLQESGLSRGLKSIIARVTLHYMRLWDLRTANGVDYFIANSEFIARRIWKVYRREATVIYPPVDVEAFTYSEEKQDYYLAASRLVPYKKMDLIVQAFSAMPDKKLVVVGDGPDMAKVKAAAGPNVEILGYQSFAKLKELMQGAAAFVFAAEEDFGITPVEAQACGTPVIAFGKGGALETVRSVGQHPRPTGLFFDRQSADSIIGAVTQFEAQRHAIHPEYCRENAMRFSTAEFCRQYTSFVHECFKRGRSGGINFPRAA